MIDRQYSTCVLRIKKAERQRTYVCAALRGGGEGGGQMCEKDGMNVFGWFRVKGVDFCRV